MNQSGFHGMSGICSCYSGESIISNPLLRKLAELRPTSLRVAQERVSGLPEMLHEDLAELLDALIQDTKGADFCALFQQFLKPCFFCILKIVDAKITRVRWWF